MDISLFDLYKIGIGPSSSHTVGPMRAIKMFLQLIDDQQKLHEIHELHIDLYGSLAMTGSGHNIERALLLGMCGYEPESVPLEEVYSITGKALNSKLSLLGKHPLQFDLKHHLHFLRKKQLPIHPNGMCFRAYAAKKVLLLQRNYYSIGGGFVKSEDDTQNLGKRKSGALSFNSAAELLKLCENSKLSISQLMFEKELLWHDKLEVSQGLDRIWTAMQESVSNGLNSSEKILPGSLKIPRRAPSNYEQLQNSKKKRGEYSIPDPLEIIDWVNLFALAVNEENAAGGRVVTAPTNGAAGILPAVLHYYIRFCPGGDEEGIKKILMTAGAIGILYKKNASISGAEVGCQGEVGVACSMAAAGLTEALGGNLYQVENAAEIGMEHNLGLTCDPIGGLVQIPCIERNAMAAVKAINASRMALKGDGKHFVLLDKVIKTMRQTGLDMQKKYKETGAGGLAVNVTEC